MVEHVLSWNVTLANCLSEFYYKSPHTTSWVRDGSLINRSESGFAIAGGISYIPRPEVCPFSDRRLAITSGIGKQSTVAPRRPGSHAQAAREFSISKDQMNRHPVPPTQPSY
jgi:hypothetical protein